jgi:hypothetical protein
MEGSRTVVRGRRRVLQTIGGTIAAAVTVPPLAEPAQHAAHARPSTPGSATSGPAEAAPAAAALPRALDGHERATLAVLGEQLVPGSTAAGVPDLLDRVLAVEPPETLRRFRSALGAFEREARARHAKPWLGLTGDQRTAVLQEAVAAAPAIPPTAGWRPGDPVLRPRAVAPSPPPTLRDHLDHLRDAVARVYYATERGSTELGWNGVEFWEGLPECKK